MKINFTPAKTFLLKNKIQLSLGLGVLIILCLSVHIFSHLGLNRYTFRFPVSGSKSLKTEVRYLSSNPVQGKIQLYVDELVLGPSFYRGRPLFTLGTTIDYCFLKDKTLYIGLSEEAALQGNGAVSIEKGIELLKKNIKKNFTGIKSIELFIDGNFITD